MAVDYRKQYSPEQLEPFWPNEFLKMSTAVLCTLAVIMFFVILPVVLDALGLHGVLHEEEPADPRGGTPIGIKPEWYFLASYQYLRIMPTELLGVSGKTLGVVTQGIVVFIACLLPFWYRRKADRRPGWAYRITITMCILALIGLTLWGGWPEAHGEDGGHPVSLAEYISHRPLLFVVLALGLIVFYALVGHERRTIRRALCGPLLLVTGLFGMASTGAAAAATEVEAGGAGPFDGNACVECHRDEPGRSSAIVDLEWKHSVHYAAGVGCESCHGGDANVRRERFESDEDWKHAAHVQRDPEFMFMHSTEIAFVGAARGRSVSYFCGKCHADIKGEHLGSPHGEFGDPTCLYCHGGGSHRIEHATLDIIDTRNRASGGRCSPCHLASTMETVARIKKTLEQTEARLHDAARLYEELEESGYRSLELQRLHDDAREVRSSLRQIFHSFNMREINNFVGEIQLTMDRTAATHEMIVGLRSQQRPQALVGGLTALMLLIFAGLLVFYRHAFLSADHAGAEHANDDLRERS